MLATSVRLRPCSERWRGSSLGRSTSSSPSSRRMITSPCSVRVSSPLGPFTRTVLPSSCTSTPAGTGIGLLPIRDISIISPLPDEGDDFATDLGRAGLTVGHHAPGGAQHGHAQAVAHARDLLDPHVLAQPRLADAAQLADDGL